MVVLKKNLNILLLVLHIFIGCSNSSNISETPPNNNLVKTEDETFSIMYENTADDSDLVDLSVWSRKKGKTGIVGEWGSSTWRSKSYPYEASHSEYIFSDGGKFEYIYGQTAIGTNGYTYKKTGTYSLKKSENGRRYYITLVSQNETKIFRYRVSNNYLYIFSDDGEDDYKISEYFTIKYILQNMDAPEDISVKPNTLLSDKELPFQKDKLLYFDGWYIAEQKINAGEYRISSDIILTGKWLDVSKFKKTLDNIQVGDIMLSNGMCIAPGNFNNKMCATGVVIKPNDNNYILSAACIYMYADNNAIETNYGRNFEISYKEKIKKYTDKIIYIESPTKEQYQIIRENWQDINRGFSVLDSRDCIQYDLNVYYYPTYNFVSNDYLNRDNLTSDKWEEIIRNCRHIRVFMNHHNDY